MKAACTDEEFIRLWSEFQSPQDLAKHLKIHVRNVYARRRTLEGKRGIEMRATVAPQITFPANGVRTTVDLQDGVILVASDCHFWPDMISTAHRAFVIATRELKPSIIVINGDAFDGPTAGRHGRIMWEQRPSIKQELEAVQMRLGEVEAVAGNAKLLWNWGNHDQRYSTRLAAQVPEFEGVFGFRLEDHFPRWKFGMSIMVNDSVVIKHRWHQGIHCSYQNVLKSGMSMVCGHTHSLKVTPYSDYSRYTRYGVDTGTLAAINGPQFAYSEDSPANHRSGFAVLTFRDGVLMPPELLEVVSEDEGLVFFRGQVVAV